VFLKQFLSTIRDRTEKYLEKFTKPTEEAQNSPKEDAEEILQEEKFRLKGLAQAIEI
jgi:hypothetical protein